MPRVKPPRPISGPRALRLLGAGAMLVRDASRFRLYAHRDVRCRVAGLVPAYVVARLRKTCELTALRGDPDRLVLAAPSSEQVVRSIPVPVQARGGRARSDRVLPTACALAGARGVRMNAAAGRFRGDYALATSNSGLQPDDAQLRQTARARLAMIDAALGAQRMDLLEMVILDKLSPSALAHATDASMDQVQAALSELAVAYGLLRPDQLAGSAFASS